jgi:hypothetical protein
MASTTPRVKPDSRAPKQKPARNSVKQLKDGIGTAVKLLGQAQDDLDEIDSYIYVCLEALAPKVECGRDDARESIARVLDKAYEKLHLDAEHNVREALNALGQDGGE